MGRLYYGAWQVLYTYKDKDDRILEGITSPATYEECEVQCLLVPLGYRIEGHEVRSAKIIGPSPWNNTNGLVV